MKDKFNKVIATGLLAAMIANFTACGDVNNPYWSETGVGDKYNTSESNTTNNPNSSLPQYQPKDLEGDVWKAMKDTGKAYIKYDANAHLLSNLPVPIQFLQDEGLLYYDENNKLCINGKQPTTSQYVPLDSQVFIDPNTKENDVYVLLNYCSDLITSDGDKNVHITTWKLKYVLDDDDYQALLQLKNDFRQRFFIQEMDFIYQPELISKVTSTQEMVLIGSPFRDDKHIENRFPNVYIDSIDYLDKIITFAARSENGYKFFELDIHESNAVKNMMDRYGITEEEAFKYIKIESTKTLLGDSLTTFSISDFRAGLTSQQAQQKFNESTREHVLESLQVNSTEINFIAAR